TVRAYVEVPDDFAHDVGRVFGESHVMVDVRGDAEAVEHLLAETVGGGDRRRVETGQRRGEPVAASGDLVGVRVEQVVDERVAVAFASCESVRRVGEAFAYALAELDRGGSAEGDHHHLFDRYTVGNVANGERRDRMGLARTRAGFEHGRAGWKPTVEVERRGHCSDSTSSRGPHTRRASSPNRCGSPDGSSGG